MGIISDKDRILDTIITEEGRRQIASGKLQAKFYSFSDAGAIYAVTDQYDSGSISQNNTYRFSFQATNEQKDSITFESDDSGKLRTKEFLYVNSSSILVRNGYISTGSVTGNTRIVTGTSDDFAPLLEGLLSRSLNNFVDQQIISSPDLIDDRFNEFLLSTKKIEFVVTENAPIESQKNGGTQDANINNVESLFADKRLSHIPNYKYLPPINKPRLGASITLPLGMYPHYGQEPIFEFSDLKKELDPIEKSGYSTDIFFSETSKSNRTIGQIFEIGDGQITKLDVIDFGIFTMTNSELTNEDIQKAENEGRMLTTKHVWFVGKVMKDDNGSSTFVNMFTIVAE
jgi:hypothetical protein